MKLPDVSGVYDYAGPIRDSRYRPIRVAFRQCKSVSVLIASFRSSIPSPPVPLSTLRRAPRDAPTQNSGPSGSLLLSRRTLAFPASCRFSPAHCIGDLTAPESLRSAAKNGSSEGSTRGSAIHHQLDRVDVRGIAGGKEEHILGQIFWLAPTAKRNVEEKKSESLRILPSGCRSIHLSRS